MQRCTIASMADLQAIEGRPYAEFMAHDQVHDALAAVAARFGARPALTALAHADDASPRRWSHAEFLAEVRRAARLFTQLAGPAEPRVALLLPLLPEAWFGLWGAEAAGVAVPVNHALDEHHLGALLDAADVNLVLTLAPGHAAGDIGERVQRLSAGSRRTVLGVGGPLPDGWIDFASACAAQPAAALPPRGDGSRLAALFHTGGTTGLPKLARHTHANQLHAAWGAAQMYAADEHDVILNGFPLFHVAGAFVYGLSVLLSGGELLLPPPAGWRDAAFVANAWSTARERGVTLMATVPTVMSTLLAAPRAEGDAAGLRLLLTGGSPLPPELAARFEDQTGVPVRNILGMTECAGVIAIEPARAPRTPGACGLPLPFSEVQADADGVLRVRGPQVGPGYTDAARNAGTFEDGWLVTGDIGHVDAQGRVYVTGRAKDVIIRGAHNIDPGVIEEALLQHPQVLMAAAVGEPDAHAGELPVAFVVAKPGGAPQAQALLDFAASRIPERAAVPRRLTLLPALPLTAIGKVYKPALRLQAAQRAIAERVAAAGLGTQVAVQGEDRGGRLLLRFVPAAGVPADVLAAPLRALMAPFALDWEITA